MCYGTAEQNLFFSFKTEIGDFRTPAPLNICSKCTSLYQIQSCFDFFFFFLFPGNENYDIFNILEIKVIYKYMHSSLSWKVK